MPDTNIMEHIDSDGKFTETFKGQITAIAGEEFKDSKALDDVPDVSTLVKNYLNTKRDYGKKLESVIQKPGKDATDTERTEYVAVLRKELGAPDSGDDYEFPKPENMPEGMAFNEEAEKSFRELFASVGTPVETVKLLVEKFNEVQIARFQAHLEEENKIFEDSSKSLKNDWKGDTLVVNARTAHAALMEFGTKDLTDLLKESKIYDAASDLTKWNSLGFSPDQLRLWHSIGDKMKSSEHIADEGSPEAKAEAGGEKGAARFYSHPSSVRDRAERRK